MICATLHPRPAAAGNCALYARAQTGVDLYGPAGGWWNEAATHYWRGRIPQVGAILVFRRTSVIPYGHVAVVAEIVGPREITVDQSNWYHGMVTRDVPVIDESPANDWTTVAVMDLGTEHYGQDYPSYGFVYPQTGPRVFAASDDGVDANLAATPTAYDPNPRLGVINAAFVADEDYRRRNTRSRAAARGAHRRRAPARPPHLASPAAAGYPAVRRHFSARLQSAVHARLVAGHIEPVGYRARTPAIRSAEASLRRRG